MIGSLQSKHHENVKYFTFKNLLSVYRYYLNAAIWVSFIQSDNYLAEKIIGSIPSPLNLSLLGKELGVIKIF